jgi:hypothetical protein
MTIQGPQWIPGGYPIGPGTNPYPTLPAIPQLPPVTTTDAIKCPDCGTWWRGYEHRCSPNSFSTTTNFTTYLPNGGTSLKTEMDSARKKAKGSKSRKRLDTDPPDMIR